MKHGTILPTIQLRYLMTAPWVAILLFFILGTGPLCARETRSVAASQIKGDANGDELVNMSDVTFLIGIILGKNEEEYELAMADVNGDGYINMVDVTDVINIILGKSSGDDDDDDDGTPPVDDDDANPGLPVLTPKKDNIFNN